MSRTKTVVAFLATVLVVAPAAWHALDADIQTDGPKTRPPQQTLSVDGAKVTLDLDRGLLKAGGKLTARLVATSDTPKTISVDVRAFEDMGYGEERVQNPPRQVGKRTIELRATPEGGKPVEVAFTLGSAGKKGTVRWFDVEVMKAGQKKTDEMYSWETENGESLIARAGAATWSGNSYALKIEPPAEIPNDARFTVAVTVSNTTRKPIDWLEIDLGSTQVSYGGLEGNLYFNSPDEAKYRIERSNNEEYFDEPLEPGKSRTIHFDVIPDFADGATEYTLTAHAHGGRGGALEMLTFKPNTSVYDKTDSPSVAAK